MSLPRLLYVGDVPVESTVAGAALLYRLFDGYPADRLTIYQSDLAFIRSPDRRLPAVVYHEFSLGSRRLLYSRLSAYYSAVMLARSGLRAARLASQLDGVPDAVVTVAHAFSWLTAARLAERHRVPLHLIVHDECSATMGVAAPLRALADARFVRAYRAAATRFCISPAMRDHYYRRSKVSSEVLYPCRAKAAIEYTSPSGRVSPRNSPFTVAFAGSLNPGYVAVMEGLATVLADRGGRLEIYGHTAPELRARLASSAIRFHPFLPSDELSERLRERADLLLVPMSFAADDAENMTLSFPAKLADHTALGIPILIVGPTYCSAVKWARENPGVAEVVTSTGIAELSRAIQKLSDDEGWRRNLAVEALRVGRMFFDHSQVQGRFFDAVASPTPDPQA